MIKYNEPNIKGVQASRGIFLVLISLICITVYWSTFSNGFQLLWDDHWVVANEYTEGGFTKHNVSRILTEFFHGQYAPVNELYYLGLYEMFGYNPFYFHGASLIVHLINAILVFTIADKVAQNSEIILGGKAYALILPAVAAVLFVIHPFLVEPVAWMSASKCILFTMFFLLGLVIYFQYVKIKKAWVLAIVGACFIFSFGAKEQAVTFPIILILIDYLTGRRLDNKKLWYEKLPFFILSAIFVVVTFFSQAYNDEGLIAGNITYSAGENVLLASYTVTEYFIKCLLPLNLSYVYPFPFLPGDPVPPRFYVYPLLLLGMAILFKEVFKNRIIFFSVFFFLVNISVASNIVPTSRYSIISDRYVYLSAIGVFILVSYLFLTALARFKKQRYLITSLMVIYVISIGIYSHILVGKWKSSITLKSKVKELLLERSDVPPSIKAFHEMKINKHESK